MQLHEGCWVHCSGSNRTSCITCSKSKRHLRKFLQRHILSTNEQKQKSSQWSYGLGNILLKCPNLSLKINPVMNKTNTIINDYLEAVAKRADGNLDYAMGFLCSTLGALKLQDYELEVLQQDTKHLKKLMQKA